MSLWVIPFLGVGVVIQILSCNVSCVKLFTRTDNRNIFLLALMSTAVKCHLLYKHQIIPVTLFPQLTTLGNLTPPSTVFFCCDMQERFRPAIKYFGDIISVGQRLVCLGVCLSGPVCWSTICVDMATQHNFYTFIWYLFFQLQGARILGIPVIITEQYPKGLGSTVQEIDLTGVKLVLPKTKFSMVLPEVEAALAEIPGVRSVVLFGVEVCTLLGSGNVGLYV